MKALPLTRTTFARLLRSLHDGAFAEFVADLWLKMDWEVDTDGAVVTASREEPRPETVRIRALAADRTRLERFLGRPGDLPELDGVDVLVVGHRNGDAVREAVRGEDVSVIDADELYYRLLYAIDRKACRSLCRRHLGRAVEPIPPSRRSGGRYRIRLERLLERAREDRRRVAGAVVVVAVVVAVATIGVLGMGGTPAIEPGSGAVPVAEVGSPVGMNATPIGTATATPRSTATIGSSTPRSLLLVSVMQSLPGPTAELPDSIGFEGPKRAMLGFAYAIWMNGEGDRGLRVARRILVPEQRMPFEQFANSIRNGPADHVLLDPDRIEIPNRTEVPEVNLTALFPETNVTDRYEPAYLDVYDDGIKTTYLFLLAPTGEADTGGPWQVARFLPVFVGRSGPDFDGEIGTAMTPTRTPVANVTRASETATAPTPTSTNQTPAPSATRTPTNATATAVGD